jgi:hypothetical protein
MSSKGLLLPEVTFFLKGLGHEIFLIWFFHQLTNQVTLLTPYNGSGEKVGKIKKYSL